MRARTGALISLLLLTACPSGDPADTVASATDSASASMGTTEVSTTSGTTSVPEPEPEPETFGSACGDPLAGQWGDCINGNAQACGNEEASCLANSTTNPAWGTCILSCTDRCDCWAAPEGSGAAEPECAPVLPGGDLACVLDCSDGQQCPDGMNCVALTGVQSLCSFDNDGFDPTGGPEPTTGDDTTSTGDDTTSSGSSSSSSTGADTDPTGTTTTGA